jgi:DNA-binding FadR family transcriptional regulator
MDEGLIQELAAATRIACLRMNATRLKAWHDSVDHASCLPARPAWERKAAAHAEIFDLLAEVSDDPVADRVLIGAASCMQGLMLSVGTAADGMVVSSRQRLLGCLRAGDADGAALEMEYHLRGLHFMWRLAQPGRLVSSSAPGSQ